jgi:hypothetical protein
MRRIPVFGSGFADTSFGMDLKDDRSGGKNKFERRWLMWL